MKVYSIYRTARIAIQIVATTAITIAAVLGIPCIFSKMQIVPAIAACSLTWLAVWLAVTLIFGRIYCSTVCPSGALMDFIAFITRRRRSYYTFSQPRTQIRLLFLAIAVIATLVGISLIASFFDPYNAFLRMVIACRRPLAVGSLSLLIAVVTFLAIALTAHRRGRLICNTVCPVGTLLAAPTRVAIYHADINPDLCTNCGRCVDVCSSECIDLTSHTVDATRCVVCFDCMAVCPNSSITYTRWRHRLTTPMLMRTARPRLSPQALCLSPDADNTQPATSKHTDNQNRIHSPEE